MIFLEEVDPKRVRTIQRVQKTKVFIQVNVKNSAKRRSNRPE